MEKVIVTIAEDAAPVAVPLNNVVAAVPPNPPPAAKPGMADLPIICVAFNCPATSRATVGAVVPMPTLGTMRSHDEKVEFFNPLK